MGSIEEKIEEALKTVLAAGRDSAPPSFSTVMMQMKIEMEKINKNLDKNKKNNDERFDKIEHRLDKQKREIAPILKIISGANGASWLFEKAVKITVGISIIIGAIYSIKKWILK